MHYPSEVIQDVRVLNDIVDVVSGYVQLKQRGGRHFGVCPFHSEKTASFSVSGDMQMFYCFGCHAGGNVISFIMRLENMDFLDALKLLADRVHYTLPDAKSNPAAKAHAQEREQTAELNKQAARYYYQELQKDTPEAVAARDYLEGRGVHTSLQKRFGLGLAPSGWDGLIGHLSADGPKLVMAGLAIQSQKKQAQYYDRFRRRLMFPIIDSSGRIVGFGGRVLPGCDDTEAKYINSPDTPLFSKSRQLYGLNIARKTRSTEMIVVEGYMDVLALHQAGFANCVGVLGTALTAEHVRLLKRASCSTVTLVLDSDEAGIRAAKRAIPEILSSGLRVKVLQFTLESGVKDPDEYIQKHGTAKFAKLLSEAKSHIAFQVGLLKEQYALDSSSETNQRIRFTEEAAKLLSGLTSAIETDAYSKEIADISGITFSAILAEVHKQQALAQHIEGGQAIVLPTPRRVPHNRDEKGLLEARKGFLNIILSNTQAALAVAHSGYLNPEELGDEIYSQLLILAIKNAENKQIMPPADVIAHFETLEAQQKTAEIFTIETLYSSNSAIEKALNDMASIIKRAWFTVQMDTLIQNNDENAVNNLFLSKRKMEALYITMADG